MHLNGLRWLAVLLSQPLTMSSRRWAHTRTPRRVLAAASCICQRTISAWISQDVPAILDHKQSLDKVSTFSVAIHRHPRDGDHDAILPSVLRTCTVTNNVF